MAKHKKRSRPTSRDPTYSPIVSRQAAASNNGRSGVMLCSQDAWKVLCADGYKPITQCSEVKMAINAYARNVAMMTIHLMRNTPDGDVRVKNELSRKVDITPAPYMGRTNLMYMTVRQMMETGNMILYPEVRNGYLEWLRPLPPSQRQLVEDGDGFVVLYNGKTLRPDEVINLVYNPDPERPWKGQGVTVDVGDMVKAIRRTNTTRNALMESPAPSLIIKVSELSPELQSPEGQDRLVDKYLSQSASGKPWMIPAEVMDVQEVKPLSIADLAIKDNLELDKKAVAAMLGVPAHMVGVGAFSADEHNNFIATKLPFITQIVEQELTSKILLADDLHFRLNKRSLMSYALKDLVTMGQAMVDRMAMDRNEWRDLMDMEPDERMHELLALENYLPADRLGDQKKLKGKKGGANDGEESNDPDDAPAEQ